MCKSELLAFKTAPTQTLSNITNEDTMTEREAAIAACCQAGLSVNQTARELGLTPGQITAVRKRLDLSFAKGLSCEANPPSDYRDAIASMRPLEAVDYLTHLLDQLLWQRQEHGLEPIAGCRLTQKEAQLTYFLHQRAGRAVPAEVIMHALYSDRAAGEMPQTHVLTVFAFRIRRKLAPHATITRNSVGFVLQTAPGVTLNWDRGITPVARHSTKWARQGQR